MRIALVIAAVLAVSTVQPVVAQAAPTEPSGQRDFDWELGTWATNVRLLRNPLSGEAPKWAEYRWPRQFR